ncbi:HAD family hydrolase [Bacillus solimangrovi]|uniref:Phosphoglycolate phosphatase n=1 Tax=Bacillus solimangrovi TaxID=1305675 RepID=A0A1E5LD09_9BACI|nr:HAD family hydrolase [Bacillus solimangrovi]OEH91953.1 phosphoglycolate phosphatase [Bacillus solimangrovi]
MSTYHNILFDLDGTISDPKEGIINSLQHALQKMGIEEVTEAKLLSFIGPPLQVSFKEIFSFTDAQVEQAIGYYREYFKERGLYENLLYDEMKELLSRLKNEGKRLFVATSKPTVFAVEIINMFELEGLFDGIVGSELDGRRINKAEVIEHVLVSNKLEKENCIMIGDRKHDIIGSNKQQIHSIAVTYGYGNKEELIEHNPTFIVNNVLELEEVILGTKMKLSYEV